MGYRSDVALVIEKSKLTKEELEAWEEVEKEFSANVKHTEEGRIIFSQSWVKWYQGIYPEVDLMMNFIISLKDYNAYSFVRIGEETGDCQSLGGLGALWISQAIESEEPLDF